jgi:hypothetical protein
LTTKALEERSCALTAPICRNFPVETTKKNEITSVKIAYAPAEIRTEHLPDSSYYYLLVFEYWGVESILDPLGTAATTGLLYLPWVIVRMEKLVE